LRRALAEFDDARPAKLDRDFAATMKTLPKKKMK
jgi:hypothetical protein